MVCGVPPCGCCEMSNRATVVLMSRTLGAETGIKVVRGGGLWSNWVTATAGRSVVTLLHCGHRVIDWV